MKELCSPEWREQSFVVKWLKLNYPDVLFTASCAGVKLPIGVATKLKAMGYSAGTPDLMVFKPKKFDDYFRFGLMIEMKRRIGGKLSSEQQNWIDRLNAEGYKAVVCHGCDDAIKVIEKYLG